MPNASSLILGVILGCAACAGSGSRAASDFRPVSPQDAVWRCDPASSGAAPTTESGRLAPGAAYDSAWVKAREMIFFRRKRYESGLDLQVPLEEIVRIGDYRGVPLFVEDVEVDSPLIQILFVPVRPGCVFRAYSLTIPTTGPIIYP